MNTWYDLDEQEGELHLTFHPSLDRFWPPEVIRQSPLPAERFRGRAAVLSGQGALWMYAHAAATLAAAGATAITVRGPAAPGTSEDLSQSSCQLTPAQGPERRALLSIQLRGEKLSEAAVGKLLRIPLMELGRLPPRELCITGRATVQAYAQVAERATVCGVEWITCWSPPEGLVVVFDRSGHHLGQRLTAPEWLDALVPAPPHQVIVGVIGDPNRGKSVLSAAMALYGEQVGECWLYDSDGQAPTPHWYLSLVRQQDHSEAAAARAASKRDWTPEMQHRIAEQMGRLRRLHPVVIADLPGGNLKAPIPRRLPPGREEIFAQVDVFVLIDRSDQSTEGLWREELRQHGLENRIVAVVHSSDPKGPPALQLVEKDGLWRGTVAGLDRDQSPANLVAAFRPILEHWWPMLLERGRQPREDR